MDSNLSHHPEDPSLLCRSWRWNSEGGGQGADLILVSKATRHRDYLSLVPY